MCSLSSALELFGASTRAVAALQRVSAPMTTSLGASPRNQECLDLTTVSGLELAKDLPAVRLHGISVRNADSERPEH